MMKHRVRSFQVRYEATALSNHPSQKLFEETRVRLLKLKAARQFIQIFNTPLRMMIVGAVHIAKPLISMGQACGYEVTLIDPRRAFASSERFPDVTIVNGWPDKVLTEVGLDARNCSCDFDTRS